jgi:hypothetical protein
MLSTFLFFFSIKIFCILCGAIFGFRLSKIRIADTPSNISIAMGYSLALCYNLYNSKELFVLLYAGKIAQASAEFATEKLVILQFIAMFIFVCFLYGTLRRYKFNFHNKAI